MYIPPSNSRLFKMGKSFNFDQLFSEMTNYDNSDHHVILLGDMNARVGDSSDYIIDDNDENLPLPEDYRPDNIVQAIKMAFQAMVVIYLDFVKVLNLEL